MSWRAPACWSGDSATAHPAGEQPGGDAEPGDADRRSRADGDDQQGDHATEQNDHQQRGPQSRWPATEYTLRDAGPTRAAGTPVPSALPPGVLTPLAGGGRSRPVGRRLILWFYRYHGGVVPPLLQRMGMSTITRSPGATGGRVFLRRGAEPKSYHLWGTCCVTQLMAVTGELGELIGSFSHHA